MTKIQTHPALSRASYLACLACIVMSFTAFSALARPNSAQTAPGTLDSAFDAERQAKLDKYIQKELVAFDVPGAAIAVLQGG